MRRLTTLLFGMALGGGLVFSAHHYHLVRTGKQFLLIPKIGVSLVDPYVDVRDWHLDDWEEHPELLAAMRDRGDKCPRCGVTFVIDIQGDLACYQCGNTEKCAMNGCTPSSGEQLDMVGIPTNSSW